LLGGGPSLRERAGLVHHGGAQNLAFIDGAAKRTLAAFAPHRADQQCEFWYHPEGWGKICRFIALRYQKKEEPSCEREQYQLFDSSQYIYRVFVTNMKRPN
jgi:hypothetical protein